MLASCKSPAHIFPQPPPLPPHLWLVAAAHVHHVRELVPAAEPTPLLPLVPKARVPEALGELAAAAAHVHHAVPFVRCAAHRWLAIKTVDAVLLAALHLEHACQPFVITELLQAAHNLGPAAGGGGEMSVQGIDVIYDL